MIDHVWKGWIFLGSTYQADHHQLAKHHGWDGCLGEKTWGHHTIKMDSQSIDKTRRVGMQTSGPTDSQNSKWCISWVIMRKGEPIQTALYLFTSNKPFRKGIIQSKALGLTVAKDVEDHWFTTVPLYFQSFWDRWGYSFLRKARPEKMNSLRRYQELPPCLPSKEGSTEQEQEQKAEVQQGLHCHLLSFPG